MGELVCFDTQMLIWGVEGSSSPSQINMISKVKNLITYLDESDSKILIPSVVVGEFLLGIPVEQHAVVVNTFQKRFVIAPYDLLAASLFARIWRSRKDKGVLKTLRDTENATKVELRADCLIVATAVARSASCIYTTDPHLEKFARGWIEIRDVPDIPQQIEMFDE